MLEISLRLANNQAQQGTEDSVILSWASTSPVTIYHNLMSLKKMLQSRPCDLPLIGHPPPPMLSALRKDLTTNYTLLV